MKTSLEILIISSLILLTFVLIYDKNTVFAKNHSDE